MVHLQFLCFNYYTIRYLIPILYLYMFILQYTHDNLSARKPCVHLNLQKKKRSYGLQTIKVIVYITDNNLIIHR